jgi:Beta-lactamase enzyme family
VVEGRASPGARRVIVRVDGRTVEALRLRRRGFVVDVDLPPRRVDVRVETVDAKGRRAGTTIRNVFGLPRAARPRLRPPRLDEGLQGDVRRLVTRSPDAAAVYVENLTSGAAAAWNARATFPAASTLKLAIAVTTLTRTSGPPARGSQVDELIRRTLLGSDNATSNRLLVMLGGSTSGGGAIVNATMRAIGLERTEMYGGYILGTSLEPPRELAARGVPLTVVSQPSWGIGKATTAVDLAELHRAIWLASAGLGPLGRTRSGMNAAEARYLMYVLAHVSDRAKLGRFLRGPGVTVLHKAGWLDAARHDAGLVVWRGGIFVAAVMTYRASGAGTRSDVLAGRVTTAALRRFRG